MRSQQVTLSGHAESPKVADAAIEAMLHIRYPTTISAPAVAWGGTIAARGLKNRARKKPRAVTNDVSPVRPPTATPAALSIYVVAELAAATPPKTAPSESTRSTRCMRGS